MQHCVRVRLVFFMISLISTIFFSLSPPCKRRLHLVAQVKLVILDLFFHPVQVSSIYLFLSIVYLSCARIGDGPGIRVVDIASADDPVVAYLIAKRKTLLCGFSHTGKIDSILLLRGRTAPERSYSKDQIISLSPGTRQTPCSM